ncbi:MAG: hypothetical protein CV089_06335 [Nitrospira sp. WS110]|nr:hypothetical protein [Nitrospira sp. WS110]
MTWMVTVSVVGVACIITGVQGLALDRVGKRPDGSILPRRVAERVRRPDFALPKTETASRPLINVIAPVPRPVATVAVDGMPGKSS